MILILQYTNEVVFNDLTYSCDNVYLKVKFHHNRVQEFLNWLAKVDVMFMQYGLADLEYYCRKTRKNGSYVHFFTFNLDDGNSFSFGVSLITPDVATMECGVVDFNPNKVGQHYVFKKFMDELRVYTRKRVIDRWDLAIDIPQDRGLIRLVKDRRDYSTHDSGGGAYTEYLGQRNKVGRVKLYNKSKEIKLDYPLTRLEITCDSRIGSVSNTEGRYLFEFFYMPEVLCLPYQHGMSYALDDTLKPTDKCILSLANECGRYDFLKSLGRKKYEKLKPYLLDESRTLIVDYDSVRQVRDFLTSYELYNIISH